MLRFVCRSAFCVTVLLSTSLVQAALWIFLSSFSLPEPANHATTKPTCPQVRCECPSVKELCKPSNAGLEEKKQEGEMKKGEEGKNKGKDGVVGERGEERDYEGKRVSNEILENNGRKNTQEIDSDDDRDYLEGLGLFKDSRHYLVFVVVLSSVKGRERRDAIRSTWKTYIDTDDELVLLTQFVIGTLGLLSADLDTLRQEQELNHDLILLPHLKESYSNLTLKVLESFIWADRNVKFSYLLKCDDDSFVMLHLIAEELSERVSTKSLYWGFFDGRASPKKIGKYIEKDWFLCDRYLPYALGGGYIVSSDLVHKVALMSDKLRLYKNEDTSVGVWLSPYEAERRHDTRFDTEFVSRGCRNNYLISHKQSVTDMRNKHNLFKTKGALCDREYITRFSYEYNWSEQPSKCCERKQGI